MDYFVSFLAESWHVFRQAAPFLIFGFFIAGMLKALVPADLLARHFGGRGFLSVLKGALLGAPLPLCSCGVLPAAMGLRRQGAGAGATTAFMIATPETGVDSLAVTYALIDPLMTALRPLSAVLTAVVAGILTNLLPERYVPAVKASPVPCASGCCGGGCSTQSQSGLIGARTAPLSIRLREGLGHAFGEMLADVGLWVIIGVLAAGAISAFAPPTLFTELPGGEFSSMLVMLVIGVPMYVCASSSTPIAASLLLKGLSPGAALVFLLTGPATNATTVTVMARTFGKALTGVYVASIALCALFFGYLTNRLYVALGFDIHAVLGTTSEALPSWVELASALLLLGLIARALLQARHEHAALECETAQR
ncbi:MAG: SO_0444 family Cu/Zn efflux transporter [Humidesulfovibrio sp.]|uniref:SO_0444 family Cu/Zn efflux transporter n=1 Tax=Humidesulfovibrio sp. TaxID=2910988 RepID=UPI0027FACA8E|nr:SO_0444 family Cu/Zn efflux transporter [Humidesulfovibrio sp.]MDQ7835847.1 SO_0444 family Cu/Zn efflux transporter [Humidesulfovibrio sp.]